MVASLHNDMATEVRLPQWSMGMEEGQVVTWHKQVGDVVAVDEPLVEIEAEKTTDDVLAPVAGTILEILVAEGETVPALTVLALIGEPGEAVASPAPPDRPSVQITPVARRTAKELGVDLASVTGTGPGGRITEYDVISHATDTPAETVGERAPSPTTTVPLTGMRRAIASRMHESLQSMAQLTLTRQIDTTELIAHQQALKAEGSGVSVTDLVLKAVAVALASHPALNARLEDDVITQHSRIDLGVAVALDDGLIVPVVRDAGTKSLAELSAEVRDLAERVRTKSANPDEVSGSTFTVTNLGAYGIDGFTPIINPPEVAILGVGRAAEVPIRDGDNVAWRQMITFSLTIDHRAVDGAPGAQFLQTLAEIIADPTALND
ncbi:MAG: 2-oxo acid dehydrogenase subunit E2 [Acidimicrobiia bacterium]|nr:2-oxo acid dehydrogenase subunit E2 [Acidimicrobiia bacterium]